MTEEITEKFKFKEKIIFDLQEKMKNLDSELIKQKEKENRSYEFILLEIIIVLESGRTGLLRVGGLVKDSS